MKYTKGKETRKSIIERARELFNEKGILLTIDQLAREMELPKSRVTNHFSTKDSLFLAILDEYEQELYTYLSKTQMNPSKVSFTDLAAMLAGVMDIQYKYRCGMAYSAITSPSQQDLSLHIQTNYKKNVLGIRNRVGLFVKAGLLKKELLEDKTFNAFAFQYTTLLTTWVITIDMYFRNEGYPVMKSIFLKGILGCYQPFLTKKGQKDFSAMESAFPV